MCSRDTELSLTPHLLEMRQSAHEVWPQILILRCSLLPPKPCLARQSTPRRRSAGKWKTYYTSLFYIHFHFYSFSFPSPLGCKNIMRGTALSGVFGTCLMHSRSYSNLKTQWENVFVGGDFSKLVSKGRRSSGCKVKSEGKLENELQVWLLAWR